MCVGFYEKKRELKCCLYVRGEFCVALNFGGFGDKALR